MKPHISGRSIALNLSLLWIYLVRTLPAKRPKSMSELNIAAWNCRFFFLDFICVGDFVLGFPEYLSLLCIFLSVLYFFLSLFRRCNTLTDIFFALHFEQSIKWSSENGNDVHFLCVWRIEICYYGNSIKTKRSIFQQ